MVECDFPAAAAAVAVGVEEEGDEDGADMERECGCELERLNGKLFVRRIICTESGETPAGSSRSASDSAITSPVSKHLSCTRSKISCQDSMQANRNPTIVSE